MAYVKLVVNTINKYNEPIIKNNYLISFSYPSFLKKNQKKKDIRTMLSEWMFRFIFLDKNLKDIYMFVLKSLFKGMYSLFFTKIKVMRYR